jgi:tRNA-Thr(GGU) m(6)t(6)A37 methyltransferase TsaA
VRKIGYTPIGTIHSPFNNIEGMPIQPPGAKGISGKVTVFDRYAEGLQNIAGFSHIILIYHLHRSKEMSLKVIPFLDTVVHGIFATRSPRRPNPIGISVVRLKRREKNVLHIEDVDILDGTPLLDIKPYVPTFDSRKSRRIGWFAKQVGRVHRARSDARFK